MHACLSFSLFLWCAWLSADKHRLLLTYVALACSVLACCFHLLLADAPAAWLRALSVWRQDWLERRDKFKAALPHDRCLLLLQLHPWLR